MKTASNTLAISSLMVANLIPLVGAMAWEWSIFSIMLIYWVESAIIGFFTILKMLRADAHSEHHSTTKPLHLHQAAKVFFIPFFLMHFGLFMFVHLIFLLVFFGTTNVQPLGLLLSVGSLFISHWLSFQTNFIGLKEYQRTTADAEMMKPYGRIIVMHLTIIFGGMLTMMFSNPLPGLMVMITLKIVVDVVSHLMLHASYLPSA